MSNALDASVTLEDVLAVVAAKRVPVAAELAGYLALEVAEGADPTGGDVDPRAVYVGEEGTVALVRRRDGTPSGDAEASVRALLGKLLEASGSQTPALAAAAKRKPAGGLPQLALELEAALIPVNRAAGRRALARLAREVRRVTLGVGRNAGGQPEPRTRRSDPAPPREPRAPVEGAPERTLDPPTVPVVPVSPPPMIAALADIAAPPAPPSEATLVARRPSERAPAAPRAVSAPEVSLIAVSPRGLAPSDPELDEDTTQVRRPMGTEIEVEAGQLPAVEVTRGGTGRGDEVDELLASFEVSESHGEGAMARDLKALAGLEPTPPPPGTATARAEDGSDIEALLAVSEPSRPQRGEAAAIPPVVPPAPARVVTDADLPSVEVAPSIDHARVAPGEALGRPIVKATALGLGPTAAPVPAAGAAPPAPAPFGGATLQGLAQGAPPAMAVPAPPAHRPESVGSAAEAIAPGTASGAVATADNVEPGQAAAAGGTAPSTRRAPRDDERLLPTAPSRTKTEHDARKTRATRKASGDTWLLVAAVVALGAGGAALFTLKPGFLTGRTPDRVATERAASEADRAAAEAAARAAACRATLTVTDVPAHAEVLLRVGQGPVDVERMPVGTRLEFVALAEGHLPRRGVVPAGATWDKGTDGKPRFELAVQLDPTRRNAADLWPAAEPGSEVGGKGPPGTVRVITTPRAAEVWLLAGVGPEARIEQLPCGQSVDVLVAGPTTYRKRLRVGAADFAAAGDNAAARTAQVSARGPR